MQQRSADLADKYNCALSDIQHLKDLVLRERAAAHTASEAAKEAQLHAASQERRMRRMKQGGLDVASAAEGLHNELLDARRWWQLGTQISLTLHVETGGMCLASWAMIIQLHHTASCM